MARIIKVSNCDDCPFISEYHWQVNYQRCTIYDLTIKNGCIIHPDCKLEIIFYEDAHPEEEE